MSFETAYPSSWRAVSVDEEWGVTTYRPCNEPAEDFFYFVFSRWPITCFYMESNCEIEQCYQTAHSIAGDIHDPQSPSDFAVQTACLYRPIPDDPKTPLTHALSIKVLVPNVYTLKLRIHAKPGEDIILPTPAVYPYSHHKALDYAGWTARSNGSATPDDNRQGTAQDHVSARYQPSNTYTDYKYWQDSEQLGPTAPKPIMTSDNAADPPLDSHQQLTKNFAVLQSKILKRLEKTITGLVEEKLDSIRSEVKSEIAKCHGEFVSIAGGLRQPQHQDLGVERTVGPSKSTDLVHHTFSTAPQSSLLDRSEGQGVSEFESNKETAYIPPHKRGWTNFSNQRYVRTREHMPQDSSSEEAAPQGRQDSLECTDLPDALRQTREICDIHHNFEALKQAYLPKFKEACEQQGTMRYESPAERYTSEGQEQALHCASSVTSVEERSVSEWQSLSDLESHPEYSVLYDFEYVDEL